MKCGGTKNIIKIDIVGKLENVVLFHTYIIWRKIMYNEEKIEVEVLPANEGECILVTIEKEDIHILIDGGTYVVNKKTPDQTINSYLELWEEVISSGAHIELSRSTMYALRRCVTSFSFEQGIRMRKIIEKISLHAQ